MKFMYFKKVVASKNNFSSLALKDDLGIQNFCKRNIKIIKFWLQILHLLDNRRVKVAYNDLLKYSGPKQVKAARDKAGFS